MIANLVCGPTISSRGRTAGNVTSNETSLSGLVCDEKKMEILTASESETSEKSRDLSFSEMTTKKKLQEISNEIFLNVFSCFLRVVSLI